ncbi:MAG TPA: GNAT family N-acetyltransferase [Pyrinomonadaceae bacterium]|nr:GNAT family N-acetyltransferase [Pyrinomonadaceae bacterium]
MPNDEVIYRPVREEEMPETVELFLVTVADLYERMNSAAPLPPRGYVELNYEHIRRTGIFQVAEVGGRLAAICHAVVRGPVWFLSGFWTLPGLQGRKIGRPLLELVRQEGARAGANVFFTWSSTDLQAMATYMKMGMLPGYQALTFAGAPRDSASGGRAGYETGPLDRATALAIDERIRGTRREADHEFWQSVLKAEARQVVRAGSAVGYYYANKGTIGPAAWLDPEDADAVLESAARAASAQAEAVRLMIPGPNHAAINFALRSGLKLSAYAHLLTTAPFGQMDKFLASGPSLF